uniref:Transposase n=1 Tax=Rhizobium rhizogenes TaxID=359 RepID=A0A7S4ZV88_RHIRH|nr:hypothetical protein pC6.5c_530 [Rhizobium rhizogenes]
MTTLAGYSISLAAKDDRAVLRSIGDMLKRSYGISFFLGDVGFMCLQHRQTDNAKHRYRR